MGRKRQLVVFAVEEEDIPLDAETRGPSEPVPLGPRSEVLERLSAYNTAPDGTEGGAMGTLTLYGPGLIAEMPTGGGDREPVSQFMVTVIDEEMAWPVLSKLCRAEGWKMMDAESGMTFG